MTCTKKHIDGTPCGQPANHIFNHSNGLLRAGRSWSDSECQQETLPPTPPTTEFIGVSNLDTFPLHRSSLAPFAQHTEQPNITIPNTQNGGSLSQSVDGATGKSIKTLIAGFSYIPSCRSCASTVMCLTPRPDNGKIDDYTKLLVYCRNCGEVEPMYNLTWRKI